MKLYTKTAILIGGVFLVFALAGITLLYLSESRHIEAEGLAQAETLNRVIFEALYATMRQGGDRHSNIAVAERLRQIEGVHELRLIHGPPVDRQFGIEADEQAQDDLDRRALAGETVQEVQRHRGVRVVRYVTPLFVEVECQRCHQAEVGEVNGAISVHVSLATADRVLAARRNALLGGMVAGLLGLGLVTFWGVQRMVVQPVQRIQAGAEALAAGDLGHRLGMAGSDEIGALARAFDDMAERVQASHDHLEDQVHQRTQALLALNAVLTATSASLNLDEVYRAFAEEIRKMVDFDRSSITVFEPGGQAFTCMVVATREKTEVGPGLRVERTPTMEWIITHQRPRIDADLTTVTDGEPVARMLLQEGLRSWMLVPIIFRGGGVMGTVNFASRQVGAYTEADGERLLPIAGQLGVALENARLYEAEKRRTAYLALLNQVGREVLASLNPDELLRRVADAVWRRFGYYNVGILLLDPQTETLVPRGVAGVAQDEIPQDVRITVGHGVMGHVAATGKTHLANDVTKDPYYFNLPRLETQAQLCVPIKVGGEVIGVLNAESRQKGAFDEMDVRAMETLADQLAMALENTRLYEQASRLAATDPLTGLANRRVFQERLAEEMRRARRYSHPLSLIMADLDHFKVYNDSHGHPAGDVVLQELAGILRANVRETDLVARYGGEEFVIMLPETDREGALEVAEKIRLAVAGQPFPHGESQPRGRLTISLGVATFPEDPVETEELIYRADQALYRAKQAGRDRVCGA